MTVPAEMLRAARQWAAEHGHQQPDSGMIEAALAAGESHAQYNIRYRKGDGWLVNEALLDTKPEHDWAWIRSLFGNDAHQVHRTVTAYPDGAYLVGKWLPVHPDTIEVGEGDDRG